jgi:hypothetical protein
MSLFSSDEKIDALGGNLMKVNEGCIRKMIDAHKTNSGLTSKLKINMSEEVLDIYARVSGRWTSHLEFNGVGYWDVNGE